VSDREASAHGEEPGLELSGRRAILAVLLPIALMAGVFAAIGSFTHGDELLESLRRANPAWLPLGLAGVLLAYAGYVLAYRDVARAGGGPSLGYWTVVRVVAASFGAFVVASAAGGLAVQYWALRRAGMGTHETIRRVLALNTIEWAWLGGVAAACGAVALVLHADDVPAGMSIAWLVVVPLCMVAASFVSAPGRGERLAELPAERGGARAGAGRVARAVHWTAQKLRLGFAEAVGGLLIVRRILLHPLRHPAGFGGFALYWLGQLLALWASLRAFGYTTAPDLLVLAYATGYVITALPLPSGGAGGVDAALVLALTAVGVPLATALLGVAAYRVFSFWLPLLPAVALLPGLGSLRSDLRHAAEGARA
jgi:uncharacterized membrane protein YbhN (UPF0104 family)